VSQKRGTHVRLDVLTVDQLKEASRVLDRSQGSIVEEALTDWFKKHNFNGTYQLNVTKWNAVLIRTGGAPQIIEVTDRNGVPPQEVADAYKKKLHAPVRLVLQEEEETWPTKKQS
jgi:hypothetical protein